MYTHTAQCLLALVLDFGLKGIFHVTVSVNVVLLGANADALICHLMSKVYQSILMIWIFDSL